MIPAKSSSFRAGVLLLLLLIAWPPAGFCAADNAGRGGGAGADSIALPTGAEAAAAGQRRRRRSRRLRRVHRVKTAGTAGQGAATGNWGGEHISLSATERGGTFELDCAHGTLEEPLTTQADGSFDVRGQFVVERGGPEREGERPESHPARLTGRIDGGKMTLRIVLTDSGQEVGEFSLERGSDPRLTKCL